MLVGRLLSAYLSSFISAVIMQWIDAENGILAFQPIGGNATINRFRNVFCSKTLVFLTKP